MAGNVMIFVAVSVVSRRHPAVVATRRQGPFAPVPHILVAVPMPIPVHPDITPAGRYRPGVNHHRRRRCRDHRISHWLDIDGLMFLMVMTTDREGCDCGSRRQNPY